jgi:hypothetical protein
MNLELLFHDFLALDQRWEVASVVCAELPAPVCLTLRETASFWSEEICPECQHLSVALHDRSEPRKWRHLDLFGRHTIIESALPRGECRHCQAIYIATPPWLGKGKHFTKPFEDHILALIKMMPIHKACQLVGEPEPRLWQMLFAYIDQPVVLSPDQIIYGKPPSCPEFDAEAPEDVAPSLLGSLLASSEADRQCWPTQ